MTSLGIGLNEEEDLRATSKTGTCSIRESITSAVRVSSVSNLHASEIFSQSQKLPPIIGTKEFFEEEYLGNIQKFIN